MSSRQSPLAGLSQAKRYKFVFSVLMSFSMSGIMSLVVTLLNLGWEGTHWEHWLKAWLLSVVIALPTMLLLTPAVDWATRRIAVAGHEPVND